MTFNCEKCTKLFSSKQMLKYHISNKVCSQNNKIILCNFCSRSYKTKYTLLQHLKEKHLKKKINISSNIQQAIPQVTPQIIPQIILQNKLKCKYCNKIFTRIDNVTRHIKKYCKKTNNNILKIAILIL